MLPKSKKVEFLTLEVDSLMLKVEQVNIIVKYLHGIVK